MKPVKCRVSLIAALAVMAMACRCSLPVSGGGTEDGNATKICGVVTDASGKGASGTRILLLHEKYNPVQTQPVFDHYETVTDASGSYTFKLVKQPVGTYNVEAQDTGNGTKALVKGISSGEPGQTVSVPACILRQTGTVKLTLPETLDTSDTYCFAEGTTVFKRCSEAVGQPDGSYVLYLDGCPASVLPAVFCGDEKEPAGIFSLLDSVTVLPGDTTKGGQFLTFCNYTKENSGLPSNSIHDLFFDRNGNTWVATDKGIATLKGETWTVYTTASTPGLPNNYIFSGTADGNGGVWFGTAGGVAHFDGSQWTAYTPDNSGLPFRRIFRIVCDRDGALWFAGDSGVAEYKEKSWRHFDTCGSGLPSNMIFDMVVDESNRIWCATALGVAIYDIGSWSLWTFGDSLKRIEGLMIDRQQRVWVVDPYGSLRRCDAGTWCLYGDTVSSVLFEGLAQTMYEDFDGNIWIGTDVGLTKYDGTSWHDYGQEKFAFLDYENIAAIEMDNDRMLWLATNRGVIAFDWPVKSRCTVPAR